jgi:hypothetical protein
MTRRRSKTGAMQTGGAGTEVVSGHSVITAATIVSGAPQTNIKLHPLLLGSSRLQLYADMFEGFRVLSFRVTFLQGHETGAFAGDAPGLVGYVPMQKLDTVPISSAQVSNLDHMATAFYQQSVPVALKLNPAILRGDKEYYDTTVATDGPGFLVFCVTNNVSGVAAVGSLKVRFDWRFEFYGRTDPAVTLNRQFLRTSEVEDVEQYERPSYLSVARGKMNVIKKK